MSDTARRFHETWLGMVQPSEGLVVSVPVLVDAQCMQRQPPAVQDDFRSLCPARAKDEESDRAIADLEGFLKELLGLEPAFFDRGEEIPEELALYVPEGRQVIRPSLALRDVAREPEAGKAPYLLLVWDLPEGLPLDAPETTTGPWRYPPQAKFDRLLRHARVPIGLLTNRRELRLVYAPHGESSGWLAFRVDDMAQTGGRPILDAFCMLLSATRLFGVAEERALPAILEQSRRRQADVTEALADQVFAALQILLAGFEAAAERDGDALLRDALEREGDHLYAGLLTVLLRLVVLLYAEDRGLLPVEDRHYAEHLSLLGLFERLQEDAGRYPDTMGQRFGAWGHLLTLFRAVYLGVEHGPLRMPPRRGSLFDPDRFSFLEGWGPGGSAPITVPEQRAAVRVPTVDDGTVFRVLQKLVFLEGQRLSYRTLDVEQIGSVYEALMGYHVLRMEAEAVCLRPKRAWVTARELLEQPARQRERWLKETASLPKSAAGRIAKEVKDCRSQEEALQVLDRHAVRGAPRAAPGRLVLQPGAERRRTSSHYTPRSLSAPIVERTLAPLLATLGEEPSAEAILSLTVCDPAMGSGAFLVEACRYLGDCVVEAWTREGRLGAEGAAGVPGLAPGEDPVLHARRLVAQRCLYGVDRNALAVDLAKLSLWLVTMARDLPFTFVDHALRHGDTLVGLDFDQIRAFHWQPERQQELFAQELARALEEALGLRQEIQALAADPSPRAQRDKEHLLFQADDAIERIRLAADLCVGAFFAEDKGRAREKERDRRLQAVADWLARDEPVPEELERLRDEIRSRIPVFHWMLEFPEVFYLERPDPLEGGATNRAACFDAFVGNPPFGGKNLVGEMGGREYIPWLQTIHPGAHGNADYSSHFFRRAHALLGRHGTIGLIATNTIAQGDTRASGLQPLVADGLEIYAAIRSQMWEGASAVAVAVVHLAKGAVREHLGRRELDGKPCDAINSRLRPRPERPDPKPLAANAGLNFVGSYVLGMGFTLTPEEREELVARDPRNAERIFPYLGGEEVNSSPTQSFHRYVIHFGEMSLEEAERWPDLIEILRERVKPERDRLKNNADGRRRKRFWWQFGRDTPSLYEAIAPLSRCLVTSRVSKHLLISFQPTDRIFAESLYVFALDRYSPFATLQSRIHELWARLLGSSMRNDLRYSASDTFDPFPRPDPCAGIPALETLGEELYEARARWMVEHEEGLTQTYNRLKDADDTTPEIVALRGLHEELDRAVLAAYGWEDVEVPPYATPRDAEGLRAVEAFGDEVIDRLFVLNAERAEEEAVRGARAVKGNKKTKGRGRARRAARDRDTLALGFDTGEEE